MSVMTTNRKQRLRTLETHIRKCANSIQKNGLDIGRDLIEIRDDELWADAYDSWNQYLHAQADELVGKSFTQSTNLIRAAEIEIRLPASVQSIELNATHMNELGRLAPETTKAEGRGREKDYSKLRKTDVARVLKKAVEIADSETPSVRDIRKAVDNDLGIDRAAKAKATKAKGNGIDLHDYLRNCSEFNEAVLKRVDGLPADVWTLLEEDHPGTVARAATACDALAEFLRS